MDARRLGELLALGSSSSGLGLLEGRLAALEVLPQLWYRAELVVRASSMGIERRHLPGEPLDGLAPRLVPLQQVLDSTQHAGVRLPKPARLEQRVDGFELGRRVFWCRFAFEGREGRDLS